MLSAALFTSRLASSQQQQQRPPASSPRLCVVRPDLVGEWIPTLNSEDVTQIASMSKVEAHWKCRSCGAVWISSVRARVVDQAHCSTCALAKPGSSAAGTVTASDGGGVLSSLSLLQTHPALAAKWDVERNHHVSPADVLASSPRRVWWRSAEPGEGSFQRAVVHYVADTTSPAEACRDAEAAELRILAEIEALTYVEPMRLPSSAALAQGTTNLSQELWRRPDDMVAAWAAAGPSHGNGLYDDTPADRTDALCSVRENRLAELIKVSEFKKSGGGTLLEAGACVKDGGIVPSFVFDQNWRAFFTLTPEQAALAAPHVRVGGTRRRVLSPQITDATLHAENEMNPALMQEERRRREISLPDTPTPAEEILDDTNFIPQRIRDAILRRQAQPATRALPPYPYSGSAIDADKRCDARQKQRSYRTAAAVRSRSAALPEDAAVSDRLEDLVSESAAADAVGLSPTEVRSMQYQRRRPVLPRRTRGGFVLPDEAEVLDGKGAPQAPQEDRRAAVVAAAAAAANLPRAPRVVARPRARAAETDDE